jgi:hypothetical protein
MYLGHCKMVKMFWLFCQQVLGLLWQILKYFSCYLTRMSKYDTRPFCATLYYGMVENAGMGTGYGYRVWVPGMGTG